MPQFWATLRQNRGLIWWNSFVVIASKSKLWCKTNFATFYNYIVCAQSITWQKCLFFKVCLKYHDKAVLEPHVSPAFAITYFGNHCNIRFENTSKYVDTLTLFSKNLNQRSLTPRWPLTQCLLRSHVWLYPRIIVSKSHDNTLDTVINFAKYHIHTHTTYILHTTYIHTHTTYRMSDHIVSYWTQFRRDKNYLMKTIPVF